DYLTKPFSPRELVARVKAALRRFKSNDQEDSEHLSFQKLQIDIAGRRVWCRGQLIELTTIEFDLLQALARHAGRVLSRAQLLEQVWGHDFFGEERVVDVHLGHIRKKIERKPSQPELIVTVRGAGYRFEDEPQ
ncbi:MAG: response regulator transcription factor, partial [Chloroflexota bacterium]